MSDGDARGDLADRAGATARRIGRTQTALTWLFDAAALVAFAAFLLAFADVGMRQALFADDYSMLDLSLKQSSLLGYLGHMYSNWSFTWPSLLLERLFTGQTLAFGIENALAFVALVLLSVANGLGRLPGWKRGDLYAVALVSCTYWFAMPAMAETVFWRTGSAVYLWSSVLMLAAAYPAIGWMLAPDKVPASGRAAVARYVFAVAVGFSAGSAHLQVASALGALLILGALFAYRRDSLRAVPGHVLALAGAITGGALLMVSAPGNFVRASYDGATAPGNPDVVDKTARGLTDIARYYSTLILGHAARLFPWLALMLGAAVPVEAAPAGTAAEGRGGMRRPWLLWITLAFASTLPFLAMPKFGAERTMSIPAVLLVVAGISALSDERRERVIDRIPPIAASALLAVVLVATFASAQGAYRAAAAVDAELRARASFVAAQRAKGVMDVTVPQLTVPITYGAFVKDITGDPAFWTNRQMAERYGVRSLKTAPARE